MLFGFFGSDCAPFGLHATGLNHNHIDAERTSFPIPDEPPVTSATGFAAKLIMLTKRCGWEKLAKPNHCFGFVKVGTFNESGMSEKRRFQP
jgi:hypothetical protein